MYMVWYMCTDALDECVALKIETAHSSATSVNICNITWHHIQKESNGVSMLVNYLALTL
jgi:hypothetical protein